MDTSSELLVQKVGHGIRLVRPKSLPENSHCPSIAHLFSLPINIGFLDTESVIQNINESTIKTSGYLSVKDTIGKTVRIAAKKESAEFSLSHDRQVVKNNKLIIKEEHFIRLSDKTDFQALSLKFPWYNDQNKLIGVFFYSIPIGDLNFAPLTTGLDILYNTGLLSLGSAFETPMKRCIPGLQIDNGYLSKRELTCLLLLIRGKTSKEIGKKLQLSHRTIEHYFERIKGKLNVSSKSELIDKVIDYIL